MPTTGRTPSTMPMLMNTSQKMNMVIPKRVPSERTVVGISSAPGFCARPDKPWEGIDYFARGSDWNIDSTAREVPAFAAIPRELRETDVNWAALERNMILEAMVQAKGRRSKAADLLGWGRSTLWRKMKQYGLVS